MLEDILTTAEISEHLRNWMQFMATFTERNCVYCHGRKDAKGDWIELPDPLYCPLHGAQFWEMDELYDEVH